MNPARRESHKAPVEIETHPILKQARAEDAVSVLEVGSWALQSGLHAEALTLAEAALRLHPHNVHLWHLSGLLHRSLEEPDAALQAFAKASELAPDDPMIATARAITTHEAGLPALPLLERARDLAPEDELLLLARASAQMAAGGIDEAIEELERRLDRKPGWIEGHSCAAKLRWLRGERDSFTHSFQIAVTAVPRDMSLWRAYIETLLGSDLYAQALAVIRQGRAAAGAHPIFEAAEAIATAELGQTEAADRLFSRLPLARNIFLLVPYVRHLLRSGRPEPAFRAAEAGLAHDPQQRLWPYVAAGWRLGGDPRWEWLEGDPRFIGVYDLGNRLPALDRLAERLRVRHAVRHQPLHQSVRGGSQTDGNLFALADPEIKALRRAMVECVEAHVAQLPPVRKGHPLLIEKRSPIRFAGSWSVRLTGGGHHASHTHPAGWLSSALYIGLPEEKDRGAGEAGWLAVGEVTELGLGLPPLRMVEPKPGRLVLFPSTMWHATRPFAAGERLTVAFDVAQPR